MNYALLHVLSGGLCVAATLNAITRRGGVHGLRLALVFLTGGAGLATTCLVAGSFTTTPHDAIAYVAGIRLGFAIVGAGAVGIGVALWTRSRRLPLGRLTVGLALLFSVAALAVTWAIPRDQIVRSAVSWHVLWPGVRWFDSAVIGIGTLTVIAGSTRRMWVGSPRGRRTGAKVLTLQLGCSAAYFALRWGAGPLMLQVMSPVLVAFIGLAYWTVLQRFRFAGVSDDALALLFSGTPTPSLVIDLQAERVLTNPAGAELFPHTLSADALARRLGLGATAEEMLATVHPPERLRSVRVQGVADRVFDLHCHFDQRRGIGLVVLNEVTERVQHADQLAAMLTELRRAQDQLVKQEKSAALGVLVAGVNHEINNPLAYVTANVRSLAQHIEVAVRAIALAEDVAAQKPGAGAALAQFSRSAEVAELKEDASATVRDALEGCDRIRETVASMRLLSRREEREELLDLSELARAGLKIGRTTLSRSIEVQSELTTPLPVRGNAGELSRVVTNLVVNAGQAMGAEGRLTVRSFERDGHAMVEVRDTGPGIPPAVRKRLFEPFFTTKAPGEGTGLGLAIGYETMRRHDGDLASVECEVGACFRLRLPLARVDADETRERTGAEATLTSEPRQARSIKSAVAA